MSVSMVGRMKTCLKFSKSAIVKVYNNTFFRGKNVLIICVIDFVWERGDSRALCGPTVISYCSFFIILNF